MKIQNHVMIVKVKPEEWNHTLVIPIPIFLVDEVIKVWPWIAKVWQKYSPNSYKETMEEISKEIPVDLSEVMDSVYELWRTIRRAGRFSLVDVEAEGTIVEIKLV